jgi:hypothetical protein
MNESPLDDAAHVASAPPSGRWSFLDLVRDANPKLLKMVAVLVAVAWIPLAVLSALRGWAAGEQFEKKWLERDNPLGEDALRSTDFAATNQLYGIASTVNKIRVVPVTRVDLISLLVAAFAPAIPLVIGALPLSFIVKEGVKLLF